jgi:2-keto-3-deoxy-L-rhamnonate aldolase RhmA
VTSTPPRRASADHDASRLTPRCAHPRSADPLIAELLAAAGLDVLIADLEHSSLGIRDLESIVRAAQLHRCPVIARLGAERVSDSGRVIETGAAGIQLSSVTAPAQLDALHAAVSPPPNGHLGLSLSHRAAQFGARSATEYLAQVAEVITVAQIESATAITRLDQLLARPNGPDVWFLGPMDLSADLGHPGDIDHPEVQDALTRAVTAFTATETPFGVFAPTLADGQRWRDRGSILTIIGSDLNLLAAATREMTRAWPQTPGHKQPDLSNRLKRPGRSAMKRPWPGSSGRRAA